MGDRQLPKATMISFIKERVQDKRKVSAEFINQMLDISRGRSVLIQRLY